MMPASTPQPGTARHVAAGSPVFLRGAPLECVAYLHRGRVALGLLVDGVISPRVGTAEGPCWLDAGTAVLGQPAAVDALAETDLYLHEVPVAAFVQWRDTWPMPVAGLVGDLARAQRQQAQWAVSRMSKDAEARCAEWLLRHAEAAGPDGEPMVRLAEHKRQIALQLGIAPETLSRVLRQLRERQLIAGAGRVLSLVDPAGLRALAGL